MLHQEPLHNHHVYQYYRWLEWVTGQDHHYFAQLHFYTMAERELDPSWRPEHLRDGVDA